MHRSRTRAAVVAAAALAASLGVAVPAEATIPAKYANCTNLHRYYPHGVGRLGARDHVAAGSRPVTTFTKSTTAYNTAVRYNAGLDRDHDLIACEHA
jgi:hypothetical protein